MKKHLIVCGHGQRDPGAIGNGINERDWTRNPFVQSIIKYGRMLKNNSLDIYQTSKDMFQQTQSGWGAYSVSTSYASVTEFHLDAATAAATGGHVIVHNSFSADKYDLAIADVIKNNVGLWGGVIANKGISYRNNLLNLNVLAQRGISYRLVELGFITSKRDTDILKSNYDKVAKELVEAITGEKINSGTSQPITPTYPPLNKKVTVLKHATNWSPTSGGTKMASHIPGGTFDVVREQKIDYSHSNWEYCIAHNGIVLGWVLSQDLSGGYGSDKVSKPKLSPKPQPPLKGSDLPNNGTYTLSVNTNLRTGTSTNHSIIAELSTGATIVYDQKIVANGYVWLRQPRGTTYGYVAVV